MRRKERQVTGLQDITSIINNCIVCRVALNGGDAPYMVPLSFGYTMHDNKLTLFFHCAAQGKKIDLIKANPNVCFEMDYVQKIIGENDIACTYTCLYESIVGTGTAMFITDDEQKRFALERIMERQTGRTDFSYEQRSVERITIFKIDAMEFSAKRSNG